MIFDVCPVCQSTECDTIGIDGGIITSTCQDCEHSETMYPSYHVSGLDVVQIAVITIGVLAACLVLLR